MHGANIGHHYGLHDFQDEDMSRYQPPLTLTARMITLKSANR